MIVGKPKLRSTKLQNIFKWKNDKLEVYPKITVVTMSECTFTIDHTRLQHKLRDECHRILAIIVELESFLKITNKFEYLEKLYGHWQAAETSKSRLNDLINDPTGLDDISVVDIIKENNNKNHICNVLSKFVDYYRNKLLFEYKRASQVRRVAIRNHGGSPSDRAKQYLLDNSICDLFTFNQAKVRVHKTKHLIVNNLGFLIIDPSNTQGFIVDDWDDVLEDDEEVLPLTTVEDDMVIDYSGDRLFNDAFNNNNLQSSSRKRSRSVSVQDDDSSSRHDSSEISSVKMCKIDNISDIVSSLDFNEDMNVNNLNVSIVGQCGDDEQQITPKGKIYCDNNLFKKLIMPLVPHIVLCIHH